jgi:hypothetical protein
MLDRCQPRHLVLSDPLIRTYARFKLTFVSETYQKAACILDDHPLEELPFAREFFDLAVMINVLDHVQDATAWKTSSTSLSLAVLILGQDLTNVEDLKALQRDPGTPRPSDQTRSRVVRSLFAKLPARVAESPDSRAKPRASPALRSLDLCRPKALTPFLRTDFQR